MARTLNQLSARTVATAKAGRHADGGGLYLVVDDAGRRKWVLRFKWDGRSRDMGLGSARDVPLAEAREAARIAREHVRAGRDPIKERDEDRAGPVRIPTFGEAADDLIADIRTGFRNEKHRAQWVMTLRDYAAPLRTKRVDEIGTADVLAVLKPVWQKRPETASRLRGRIERVLDAARARNLRSGDNPARWRGHLDKLLPKPGRLTRGHPAAMPFEELPGFMGRLRAIEGPSARALEFAILTAARSGEVLAMTWAEVDMAARVWTVPAARMKAGREHRVPLSPAAMAMVLRRLATGVTVHGFRSTFRDWAGESTPFPREVAEAALAHVVGDATERAYRRGDALEKRRKLMDSWAGFCDPLKGDNVVVLRKGAA